MMPNICNRCHQRPVEDFGDEFPSYQCGDCNDREIERYNRRAEWDHYHPGEPIPKSELEGK